MPAPLGNKFGEKLKDPQAKIRAFNAYCDWLASGKTKKSFSYEEGDLSCVWATVESYMKADPEVFDTNKRDAAYARGCAKWEQVVDDTGLGLNKETSVPCLNMIMRNKYKWDTPEASTQHEETRSDLKDYSAAMKSGRAEQLPAQASDHSDLPECAMPPQA